MNWLKEAISPLDVLIALGSVYMFWRIGQKDVISTFDYVTLVVLGLWLVMLVVRCLIYWSKRERK